MVFTHSRRTVADNPNPDDKNAGMKQVNDPINECSMAWDIGVMNLDGIIDDLNPDGFVSPPQGPLAGHFVPEGADMDQNGNPLYLSQATRHRATKFRS